MSMADPFGEQARPWWVRVRRQRDRSMRAPKRYSIVAVGVGACMGLAVARAHGVGDGVRVVLVAIVPALPHALIEWWWRRQLRLRAEQPFVTSTAKHQ